MIKKDDTKNTERFICVTTLARRKNKTFLVSASDAKTLEIEVFRNYEEFLE